MGQNKHIAKAEKLYQDKGATAVYDYANKNNIPYEYCKACAASVPHINHNCLICGQTTTKP